MVVADAWTNIDLGAAFHLCTVQLWVDGRRSLCVITQLARLADFVAGLNETKRHYTQCGSILKLYDDVPSRCSKVEHNEH